MIMITSTIQHDGREAYTRDEVAAKLGMCSKTWARLVKADRAAAPDLFPGSKIQRWSRAVFDQFLAEQTTAK
jgi:hypothetical protein